jgi:uncharacterized protein (TIGR02118 family)
MSVSYFVRYDIEAPDLKGFLERYRKLHVPLVAKWPGLQRMTMHLPVEWKDPAPVNRGKAVLMAQLEFESEAAMNAAFASAERAAAREDFKRFPRFGGSVVHQAMAQEEVFRAPWLDGNEEGA